MLIRSRVLGVVLVVLMIAVVAGCASEWLAGGKLHFDEKRYERALENFQMAVEEQPENAEAHLWLARALAELDRDEEAVGELALAGQPALPELVEQIDNTYASYWSRRYNTGVDLARKGDGAREKGDEETATAQLTEALAMFKRAALFCPDSVKNYSNMGKVLFQLGRRDEGRVMFDKARGMAGDEPELLDFLFRVYRSLGIAAMELNTKAGYEDALVNFGQAVEFDRPADDLASLWFNMGIAHTELATLADEAGATAEYNKAIEAYEKVLALMPDDEGSLKNLANIYSEMKQHDKAIEVAKRMIDMEPYNQEHHFTIMRLYNAAGDPDRSAAHLMLQSVLQAKKPVEGVNLRTEAGQYGPGSDMLRVLRDRGEPNQYYRYTGTRGTYDIWFYWAEGRVYVFQAGKDVFRTTFRPLPDWEAKLAGE